MVSIKDVARVAGVSTATVSRVLSNKPHVREQVRNHVLCVIKEMGYRPNHLARSLRTQKANILGLIVSDIQNPFFSQVSRAVEDTASQKGMSIFLCNTDEDPEKEDRYLKVMRDERVSGIIFSPTQKLSNNFIDIKNYGLPMVIIDRRVKAVEIDSIQVDNIKAAKMAVKHLINHGCKRIAALFGTGSTTGKDRHEGYIKALEEHDLQPKTELVKFVEAKKAEGYKAVKKLLNLPKPPDAIFTSNGLLSAGAFEALGQSSIKIPEEIALITFDETPWSTLVNPPLTVIAQPTYDIGKKAVQLLVKRIQDPTCPFQQITLKSKLVVRQSCGCIT
ncbi:MAG: LacI family transcriptional regulator [Desulfobacteraceae bacterium]|nr:LacI family transcriptional regulator [Desulfobacteraceae bacterium]